VSRTRDWDAGTYQRVSDPQVEWAREVLERLPLRGDETVLDAGCGSGRVTQMLLHRLPHGRVFAVDAAPSMVDVARANLDPERTTTWVSDLVELEVPEPVDAVLSTAVFHWIPDHPTLFERLYAAMKPGARLVVQCGGVGNIDGFHGQLGGAADDPEFAPYFEGMDAPWNFATPAETAQRLARAGFADVECWLQDRPVTPDEPREFLRVVCLGHHLERLPEDMRDRFVDTVCERAGSPLVLDYVRLNIDARKPESE
jgi:trans-aconitate 2-methyltransferase